jgi:DNA-directed RNA polymerase subunit M/transcription elongation factor TFIIS
MPEIKDLTDTKEICPKCGSIMKLAQKTTSISGDSFFCESCRIWFVYKAARVTESSTLIPYEFSLR